MKNPKVEVSNKEWRQTNTPSGWYLCSLMLPPTNMTELAATTTPVFQLILQRALVLLQTKLVEGFTTDLAIHKLKRWKQRSMSVTQCIERKYQLYPSYALCVLGVHRNIFR